jgi:hypothetical protein
MLLLAASSTVALADGAVSLTWTGCTGPANIAAPGGNVMNAFVSVLGQTQTAQSYQCVTAGNQAGGPMRDAWRFDPAGCDNGFFTLNHTAPSSVSKVCPSFQGALQSLQIKDYSIDPVNGKAKITLANAYPNGGAGNPAATNAAVRYFLANYVFDMSFAVAGPGDPPNTCGGIDVPACFALVSASWLDTAGNEISWNHASNDWITTNDPNDLQHCPGSVPVRSTTWGNVKGQYR